MREGRTIMPESFGSMLGWGVLYFVIGLGSLDASLLFHVSHHSLQIHRLPSLFSSKQVLKYVNTYMLLSSFAIIYSCLWSIFFDLEILDCGKLSSLSFFFQHKTQYQQKGEQQEIHPS
jgi:hypothetical protein